MNRSLLLGSLDNVLIEMFPSFLAPCGDQVYWLPFTPRLDRIHSYLSVYYSLVVIEAISLILSFNCMLTFVVLFSRHQIVHVNLIIMLILHGVLYAFSCALRLLQLVYELEWIANFPPGCFPVPQIVIVRLTSYISVVLLLGGVVVERAFATHYVTDYESKNRPWIAFLITLFLFALSFFISAQIVQGGINGVFFAAAMVAPVCLSLTAFRLLLRRNMKRLGALNTIVIRPPLKNDYGVSEYTLSLRLQLRENIWTMKKLNQMATVITPICLLCLPFLFIPPFFLRDNRSWWILDIIIASNNTVLAAIAPVVTVLIIVIFEEVRIMIFPKRRRHFHRVVDNSSSKSSESDQHFDQLRHIFQKPE